jgi:hypothetical protein
LRVLWLFLESILTFFLELNLFLRRLNNLSHELRIFYLDSSSCLKLSLNHRILLVPPKLLQFGRHQIFSQRTDFMLNILVVSRPVPFPYFFQSEQPVSFGVEDLRSK